MSQSPKKSWRLFNRTLLLFLSLGVIPILLIAIVFALPVEWQLSQYRTVIGLLLILATISTLCLAGLVTRVLKQPVDQLLHAQKEIQIGNLSHRLVPFGSFEMQQLADGFNHMAKSVEMEKEREKELAEQRSFTMLASQVVHDLRSPLMTLAVVSKHFNNQQFSDSDDQEMTKMLQSGTTRLQNIANELLQEKKKHQKGESYYLHESIKELISEFQSRLPDSSLTLGNVDDSIKLSVKKIDLQRAIGNVITNAIEAIQTIDGGKIKIGLLRENDTAIIRIEDTGPGMEAHILQKVLQGGFTHGKQDGNGVGMTVVRQVVEKYNGSLDCQSIVGKGTTFIIRLPSESGR